MLDLGGQHDADAAVLDLGGQHDAGAAVLDLGGQHDADAAVLSQALTTALNMISSGAARSLGIKSTSKSALCDCMPFSDLLADADGNTDPRLPQIADRKSLAIYVMAAWHCFFAV